MGKVYRRCLQVHPDKVDIRISSARYELDLAMADERSDASAAADSGLRVENARFVVSLLIPLRKLQLHLSKINRPSFFPSGFEASTFASTRTFR